VLFYAWAREQDGGVSRHESSRLWISRIAREHFFFASVHGNPHFLIVFQDPFIIGRGKDMQPYKY